MSRTRYAYFALIAATLLVFCLPCAAQTVVVSEDAILIDGVRIRLPATERAFERVIGGVPVRREQLADEYSNRVLEWRELGLVAFSNPRNRKVHAIELLFTAQPYWKGVLFGGAVEVNGKRIAGDTPPALLEQWGFEKQFDSYEWR